MLKRKGLILMLQFIVRYPQDRMTRDAVELDGCGPYDAYFKKDQDQQYATSSFLLPRYKMNRGDPSLWSSLRTFTIWFGDLQSWFSHKERNPFAGANLNFAISSEWCQIRCKDGVILYAAWWDADHNVAGSSASHHLVPDLRPFLPGSITANVRLRQHGGTQQFLTSMSEPYSFFAFTILWMPMPELCYSATVAARQACG